MFHLDSRIEKDSSLVASLQLCQLRIQNDQRYPWLVLVPVVQNQDGSQITEVHELSIQESQQLMHESNVVAATLKKVTGAKKINVANLGNVCSQLHWHVVARFENDLTWPGPIWGVGQAEQWNEKKRHDLVTSLLKVLADKDSSLIKETFLPN